MIYIYIGCLIAMLIIGKIFIVPIKWIIKLLVNSLLGAVLLSVINLLGAMWSFHIGINLGTALTVGILGIPGAILLMILKLFLG